MSQKLAEPFLFESRVMQGSNKRQTAVGIRCKTCPTEEWHAASNAGWGRRIFKGKGWDVGQSLNRHYCPACVAKRYEPKHHQPKPVETVAHASSVPETAIPTLPELQKGIDRPLPDNSIMADRLAEALAEKAMQQEPAHAPAASPPATARKRKTYGASDGFPQRGNAERAARNMLMRLGVENPRLNVSFRVTKAADGTFGYTLIGSGQSAPLPAPKPKAEKPAHQPKFRQLHKGEPTGFLKGHIAKKAAERALQKAGVQTPKEGRDYKVIAEPGGTFGYELVGRPPRRLSASDAPALLRKIAKVDARLRRPGDVSSLRNTIRTAAIKLLKYAGVPNPENGHEFQLYEVPGGWTYRLNFDGPLPGQETPPAAEAAPPPAAPAPEPAPPPETPMSDASTQAVRDLEAAKASPPPTVRQPSLADKRRVREAVEEFYDEPNQRWRGEWSDKELAEKLDVPRAWVTTVREFYGPNENNAEKLRDEARRQAARARVEAANDLASKALEISGTIIEMAAKLETIMSELKAKREEIG